MKFYLLTAFGIFVGLCTIALAGAPPAPAAAASSCHGQALVAAEAPACHGRQMLAPAVTARAACHGAAGSRLSLGERMTARSAARSNYRTTLAQFRDAGRKGDVSAVAVQAQQFQYVPAAEAKSCDCPAACTCPKN